MDTALPAIRASSTARPFAGALRAPRSRRAFTLTELLIVVVVLAIIALLAMPGQGSRAQLRVLHAARLLMADIDLAQIRSLGRGDDPYVIVFDPDGAGYHVARSSDPAVPLTHPSSGAPNAVRFGEGRAAGLVGVTISVAGIAPGDPLVFTAFGSLADAAEVTITISSGGESLSLIVDPMTGDVSLQ